MKYKDLLANINSQNYRQSRTLDTAYIALLAVVKLHTAENGDFSKCYACDRGMDCPTLDAIAKELV